MLTIEEIKKIFRCRIVQNEPMSRHTSFAIGGPADYFIEPFDKKDAMEIVSYLQSNAIPFIVIGQGSNLLISDEGIRGVVINLERGLNHIYFNRQYIVAESGVRLTRFVDFCIDHSRKGIEMLAGIPGTIGGALVMNAGAFGGEISNYLIDVEIIHNGSLKRISKQDAGFMYRQSALEKYVILEAVFDLPEGDKAELIKKRSGFLAQRIEKQPLNFPNCGSVFKNPPNNKAAQFIDKAGLKGAQFGKAQISEKHANFIINQGGASANDVLELIKLMRRTIQKKFGIQLELEVKLIGFRENILKEVC